MRRYWSSRLWGTHDRNDYLHGQYAYYQKRGPLQEAMLICALIEEVAVQLGSNFIDDLIIEEGSYTVVETKAIEPSEPMKALPDKSNIIDVEPIVETKRKRKKK